MSLSLSQRSLGSQAYNWAGMALFVAVAIILGALAFEHLGGYKPCPLCLQQRWAYYAGIPMLFIGLVLLSAERPQIASLIFLLVAVAFLANAALGVYHAGAEWKYWAGPDTCSGTDPVGGQAGSLLERMRNPIVRCDEPALVIFGLSLAGWNAIISAALFLACAKAAFAAGELRRFE